MNRRKRVEMALQHEEADRIPWDCSFNYKAYENLKKYLGISTGRDTIYNHNMVVRLEVEVVDVLEIDLYYLNLKKPSSVPKFNPANEFYVDEFGVAFKKIRGQQRGIFNFEPFENPLKDATFDEIRKYHWPTTENSERIEGLEKMAKTLYEDTDLALVGQFDVSPFTQSMFLRGVDQWFLDFTENQELVSFMLNKITDIAIELNKIGLKAAGRYLTMLMLSGDDLGSQNGMLISPATFRNLIKPVFKRYYEETKKEFLKYNPNGKIFNHTCGDVFEIIPDYIEIGLDVLSNLQPVRKMDHKMIKQKYGDRLCFHGGVDIHKVLNSGSPDFIKEEVKKCIKNLGINGGYIIAPTTHILHDISPQKIVAMRDYILEYGKYPLQY